MRVSARSVSDRRPGRAARVVDPEEMAVGGDPDQLDRPPGRLLGEAIAALGERLEGRRGKAIALVKERIRQPLVMKARRGDGILRGHREIEDVGYRLEHGG